MLKRVIALTLSLLLFAAMLPMSTSAAATEDAAMRNQIRTIYRKVQRMVGWNLHGFCGLMTDYQLYFLGVDTTLNISDGNGQYDEYKNLDMTNTGHKITRYPAADYSLREALYTMTKGGTRDVYNILIGFQWTNTQAGSRYGHACVIHAILDGQVYFTEGFYTPMGGAAGNPAVCSIETFADYYDSWTQFEGAVEFGKKEYTDFCQSYSANLFVQATVQTPVISNLADADNADAVLRQVPAGERLHATGLYKNTLGQYYYQVNDSGATGFVAANDTRYIQARWDDVQLTGVASPGALKKNKDFTMSGTLSSMYSMISGLEVVVTDASGNTKQSSRLDRNTCMTALSHSTLNKAINFGKLEVGSYTYTVNAYVKNHYLVDGQLVGEETKLEMHKSVFTVGGAEAGTLQPPAQESVREDGWQWENSAWYYYENSQKRTGWFCDEGVNYYLQEDGSAANGWVEINGRKRFFSQTGAMRTGWVETAEGSYYLLSNGAAAVGWIQVDGQQLYFDTEGRMCRNTWVTKDGSRYYFTADGTMATGWIDLPEGSKCFREDGRLYAEVCKEGGTQYIRFYDEEIADIESAVKAETMIQELRIAVK